MAVLLFSFEKCVMITNILLVFNKTCSFMQKKNQFDRRSTTQKNPVSPKSLIMNNSYFVCDVAPMKLCYPHAQQSIVCTVCIYCYYNNVEKKLHKNFMPLLTHENACIIYTEVTWRLLFTLGCSWVVRHPFSLVYKSAGTISWIS